MAFSRHADKAPGEPPSDLFAPLDGKSVSITNVTGAFRACVSCGNETATVSTEPLGAHNGSLRCTKCACITAYLSRDHLAAMLAAHRAEVA